MGGDEIGHPPRWAEALLRTFLNPEEAETQSGDLLEAYRDSILPGRGRRGADLWFLRQVAGYILRARGTQTRNWVLAGVALSVLTVVVSILRYPGILAGAQVVFVALFLLFFAYAAVFHTRPRTPEESIVLRLGSRYGLAIGALTMCGILALNFGIGIGVLMVLAAISLPVVAGAHAGITLWRVGAGLRVGFWSGIVSGLMLFLGLMAYGYILAFIPGIPGAEFPPIHPYTAMEYQRANVGDTLGGGLAMMIFGFGFEVLGATVGSWLGMMLARTGGDPRGSGRIVWSVVAFCMLGATMLSAGVQSPQFLPSFEVASIRINKSGNVEPDFRPVLGGRLTVNNVTMKTLITAAYHIASSQISGGPGWIDSDRFDINAKAEKDVPLQEALVMLQTLLKDRFKLVFHREMKDVPAYRLTLLSGNGAPKLVPSQGGESGLRAVPMENQKLVHLSARNMTMQHLSDILGNQLQMPVVDNTGLSGAFDFAFDIEMPSAAAAPDGESISAAFRDQLGLKLDQTKAPAEFFVIEKVERPTDN
jgi:uncharacterized protein (TIGR03435 family)